MRIYQTGSIEVQALQGLDLLVADGEMVAVVGASGLGQVDAALDPRRRRRADRGAGPGRRWDLLAESPAERVRYRRHVVGLVRQQTARNLVPYLTAAAGASTCR